MRKTHRGMVGVLTVLTLFAIQSNTLACLWDYDTLRDEQRGLPEVSAILAGKWEKHSEFFYEQRVAKMRDLLNREPANLPAIDNLAVALEKLGKFDEAIEIMQKKLEIDPDGYTAHANLGTFYLHRERDGDVDLGIQHIERALAINPDAHFGREKYQLLAAKYLRDAATDPVVLDRGSFVMPMFMRGTNEKLMGETEYWVDRALIIRTGRGNPIEKEINHAITGVVGMIRFGTGKSPHLYFALGDLLASRGDKHLAYRAYRLALKFGHPRPELLKEAMKQVSEMQEQKQNLAEDVIESEERSSAEWVSAYQAFEDDLVRRGVDTDIEANYAPFYEKQSKAELISPVSMRELVLPSNSQAKLRNAVIAFFVIGLALAGIRNRWRANRRAKLRSTINS